ncbi:MAG: insulinase family protein [bacterium]|nr:insulinase family protein [bacterium]
MKKAIFALMLAACLLAPAWAEGESGAKHADNIGKASKSMQSVGSQRVEAMNFGTQEFRIPAVGKEITRRVLSNGIVVYMYRENTLPIVNMWIQVKGGYLRSPKSKMSDFASSLMRRGGTRSHSSDEMDKLLEVNAISIQSQCAAEDDSLKIMCLPDKLPLALSLSAEMIEEPAFDEKQFSIIRDASLEKLRRRNDDPGNIAGREYAHLIYGDDRLGHITTNEDVLGVTSEDIKKWHELVWTPDRAFIAAAGDFDEEELVGLLEKTFSSWKANGTSLPELCGLGQLANPGIYFADKDINQSTVKIGGRGLKRGDPDSAAGEVMNYILGGGSFSSRLVDKVRTQEGLAYSINSRLEQFSPRMGLSAVTFQTKAASTREAADYALAEIDRIKKEPVSAKELAAAKEALLNSMIFLFENPFDAVCNIMVLEPKQMPLDYFERRMNEIRSVTDEDVMRAARRFLHEDDAIIVVVGNKSSFSDWLREKGANQLNIELP